MISIISQTVRLPIAEILTMKFAGLVLLVSSFAPTALMAQNNFFTSWEARVKATSAKQPGWAVPVFAATLSWGKKIPEAVPFVTTFCIKGTMMPACALVRGFFHTESWYVLILVPSGPTMDCMR